MSLETYYIWHCTTVEYLWSLTISDEIVGWSQVYVYLFVVWGCVWVDHLTLEHLASVSLANFYPVSTLLSLTSSFLILPDETCGCLILPDYMHNCPHKLHHYIMSPLTLSTYMHWKYACLSKSVSVLRHAWGSDVYRTVWCSMWLWASVYPKPMQLLDRLPTCTCVDYLHVQPWAHCTGISSCYLCAL